MIIKSLAISLLVLILSGCTDDIVQMPEIKDAETACQFYGGVDVVYNMSHFSARTDYTVRCVDGTEISRSLELKN